MDITSLILGLLLLVLAGVWVWLCAKEIIPDPLAKWTLFVTGGVVIIGTWILWNVFRKAKPAPVPVPTSKPIIIETQSPTEREIEKLDKAKEDVDKRVEETHEKLEKLDELEEAVSNGDGLPDDVDVNSDFGARARDLSGED